MCKQITHLQYKHINDEIDRALCGWCYSSSDRSELLNAIRLKFNVQRIHDLPAEDYTTLLSFVSELADRAYLVLKIMDEFKHYALKEVVMGGAPFTQVIIKDYRKQFDTIPKAINWVEMVDRLAQARSLVIGAEV